MLFPKVFVLNLRRSPERKAFMSAQADRHGLAIEFVECTDGEELRLEGHAPPSGLSWGEGACLRTHVGVWRRIADGQAPVVVLEDDVQLAEGLKDIVSACLKEMAGDDLLLLGHHSSRHGPREGAAVCFRQVRIAPGYGLGRVAEFTMGAYAAVISPGAARRLVRFAQPERMPTDWVTGYSPRAGIRLLAVTPPCVTPAPIGETSTILDREASGPRPIGVRGSPVPRWLSDAWLFVRRLGIAPSSYAFRLER